MNEPSTKATFLRMLERNEQLREQHRMFCASRAYVEALDYMRIRRQAEEMSLAKAETGDRHGAYDDASDHTWATAHVAVRVLAWLAGGAP